jgi:hypothetical protein
LAPAQAQDFFLSHHPDAEDEESNQHRCAA